MPNLPVNGAPAPTFFGAYGQWMGSAPPSWEDVAWLRSQWDGPFMLKGVTRIDDAKRAVDAGVSAISVSNHGGNNLDGTPATIRLLPDIARAVGDQVEVLLDGGVRRGSDVVKALALGARAVMIGRAYLWGLGANGQAGRGERARPDALGDRRVPARARALLDLRALAGRPGHTARLHPPAGRLNRWSDVCHRIGASTDKRWAAASRLVLLWALSPPVSQLAIISALPLSPFRKAEPQCRLMSLRPPVSSSATPSPRCGRRVLSRRFQRAAAAAAASADPVQVNVGAGTVVLPGWINTDVMWRGDMYLDLTRPWPVPSQSVDRIYADNVIEHFSLKVGRDVLRNCHNALRPGGGIRLATPDLERTARAYLENAELTSAHLDRHRRNGYPAEHPADMLRVTYAYHGHHEGYIFDWAALSAELMKGRLRRRPPVRRGRER